MMRILLNQQANRPRIIRIVIGEVSTSLSRRGLFEERY